MVESQYVYPFNFITDFLNILKNCMPLIRWLLLSSYIRLLSCVTEHLTAEIVQLTVSDITRAIEWMKCSYLYVRMKKARASADPFQNIIWILFFI